MPSAMLLVAHRDASSARVDVQGSYVPVRGGTRPSLSDEAIRFQYEAAASTGLMSPDGWTLDIFYMHRPDAYEIQLDRM